MAKAMPPGLQVSPNEKYFALTFSKDGSTDLVDFRIFDFEKRAVLTQSVDVFHGSGQWGSDNFYYVRQPEAGK